MISTAKRPIPLEHYLYAGKELWKIVDASRNFLGQGYKIPSAFPGSLVGAQGCMCFPGTRMPARRYGVSKIRNVKLRAFPRYSGWVRAPLPRSEELVDCLQVGVAHQLEEGVR